MLTLQFHTPLLTGFSWETKTHRFVANVHDTRGVNIGAFNRTLFADKDEDLSARLSADCTLTDFLKMVREKLKEGATPNALRADRLIV